MIQLGQLVYQKLVVTEVTQSRMLKKLYHFDDKEESFFVYVKQHLSTCLGRFIRKVFFWTAKLFWFALKERERIIIPFLENWKLKEPDRGRDGGGS